MKKIKRIAYYLWRFPILSETFIRREIDALKQCDYLDLTVIADYRMDNELMDEQWKARNRDIHYLFPADRRKILSALLHLLGRRLLRLPGIIFLVFSRHYQFRKNWRDDIKVVLKIVFLAEILYKSRIDHLHAPWADVNAFIGMAAARLAGIPFSLQARAHDIHRRTSIYALKEKFDAAKFVITNTCYNVAHIRKIMPPENWKKIHHIYNGIPLSKFSPNGRIMPIDQPVKILAVGRLIEQKGFHHLLHACKRLRDRGYRFHCEIIGGPELPIYQTYYRDLMRLYDKLKLRDWVTFSLAQPVDKVLAAYHRSDIFVLPSVLAKDGSRDIIPNAVIEAMATRLPVVSTTVTGIPEIVDHEINGILVPPHDAAQLADALIRLIEHPALRRTYGEKGRLKAMQQFDIEKNIGRYIALFSD